MRIAILNFSRCWLQQWPVLAVTMQFVWGAHASPRVPANVYFVLSWVLVNSVLTMSAASPTINFPPRSQTVILFQQAAFGVIASGTPPLVYQWRKDGVPIAGATKDQIVLAHAQFSDAGRYSVLVSNAEGSVTSAEVGLTVNPPKAGDVDFSFVSGGSINGPVRSISVQADGKILIAGEFTTVHGAVRGRIARLNADGTTDYTFMNGLSGAAGLDFPSVTSVAVQGDGRVVIGGQFTSVHGVSRNNLARLNADGTLDSGFQNGMAGVGSGYVHSVALQSDGKVLIAGGFTTVNGVSRTNIARLNADGTLDSGFRIQLPGLDSGVSSIAVQSDGKVIIGGRFTKVNGVNRTHIARLNVDGTLDSDFQNVLFEAERFVSSVAVQRDGKVLIGGYFAKLNGVSRKGIARLNADGALDTSFQDGLAGAAGFSDASVISLAPQSDGKLLFSVVNDERGVKVARLNGDGTLDSGFLDGLTEVGGADYPSVNSVAVQSDGKVLIGGLFDTVNSVGRAKVARLNADGTLDREFVNGISGAGGTEYLSVNSVAVQSDGKVLMGGKFTTVNGVGRNGIARLNADGTLDSGFVNGLSTANVLVFSLGLQGDGKVLIGGWFNTVNGVSRTEVARLNADGTRDSGFAEVTLDLQISIMPPVHSLVIQADGKVLIGGQFNVVNDVSRNSIARINADGTLDTGFLNGLPGTGNGFSARPVASIALQSDGKVLVGGGFTKINGVSRNAIARLNADGTLDTGFQNGLSGVDGGVSSIALQSDGKVLVGGGFTNVNAVSRNAIARLNADGTLDSDFLNVLFRAERYVSSVVVQSDGKVLIGGYFTAVNGVSRTNIARLNLDGTLDSRFQDALSGTDGIVLSMAVQSDGKVLIAGGFTTVNGMPAAGIARLWGSSDVPPRIQSVNRSGTEVKLTWDALPNRTYRVQYKADLSENNWTDLAGDISSTAGTANKTDTTVGSASRGFYRVVLLL